MSRWQRLMDPTRAAEYLGIPAGTLGRWRAEGSGPPYLKVGGSVRYEKTALDSWMSSQIRNCSSESAIPATAVAV